MSQRPKPVWVVAGGLLALGVFATVVWSVRMQSLAREIERRRTSLKSLHVGGELPPNQEVVAYLQSRTAALETQYESAVVVMAPPQGQGQGDPQLFFQQRLHEIQRTLDRLATARGIAAPALLGFPKELPPPDAVPRFLTQVGVIEDTAKLILSVQGMSHIESFKVEDPQAVVATGQAEEEFLTSLPVAVRLTGSLDALTKTLALLDRARPFLDLQALRVASPEGSKELKIELSVTRYLVTASLDHPETPHPQPSGGRRPTIR